MISFIYWMVNMSDELQIMREIVQRLEPLDAAARSRVLGWLISVLEIQDPRSDGGGSAQKRNVGGASVSLSAGSSTFAELFHLAAPKTEKEKALVAAYWIQRTGNGECFASQQVNTELKHIGYGVTNITDALSQLIEDRPSAVIQ